VLVGALDVLDEPHPHPPLEVVGPHPPVVDGELEELDEGSQPQPVLEVVLVVQVELLVVLLVVEVVLVVVVVAQVKGVTVVVNVEVAVVGCV